MKGKRTLELSEQELKILRDCVDLRIPKLVYKCSENLEWFFCPNCENTLDREYMCNCNCCGQRLLWNGTIVHLVRQIVEKSTKERR